MRAFIPILLIGSLASAGCGGGGDNACGEPEPPVDHSPFTEPDVPYEPRPPIDQAFRDGWAYSQVAFPPEASTSVFARSYWLTGGEDIRFDVIVGLGNEMRSAGAMDVAYALLIDGVQVPLEFDGEEVLVATRSLSPPGELRFSVRVSGTAIPDGAHTATLLRWFPTFGWLLPPTGDSFVILKNDVRFDDPQLLADATVSNVGDEFEPVLHFANGEIVDDRRPIAAPPDGQLDLRLAVYKPDDETALLDMIVVALLDGMQIPVGEHGLSPRLSVRVGQKAELDLGFSDLPPTGTLVLHGITGYQAYAECSCGVPCADGPGDYLVGQLTW